MRIPILGLLCVSITLAAAAAPAPPCDKEVAVAFQVKEKGKVVRTVKIFRSGRALFFIAGMAVDADGAPNAYGPKEKPGLDFLENAGSPGNFFGIATGNDGKLCVQKTGEFAGMFVSTTALQDSRRDVCDTEKYVDSRTIPYYVLPRRLPAQLGMKLGDLGMAFNTKNGSLSPAVFAEIGPAVEIGEGSIALGKALGMRTDLRHRPPNAGQEDGVVYLVFPDTHGKPPWPRTLEDIRHSAEQAFAAWGGLDRLKACVK
jgi:hypothetical protein